MKKLLALLGVVVLLAGCSCWTCPQDSNPCGYSKSGQYVNFNQ